MVIHDPEEQPLIDEFGIAINPATYTLAAITEVSAQNKKTIAKTNEIQKDIISVNNICKSIVISNIYHYRQNCSGKSSLILQIVQDHGKEQILLD